MAEVHSVRASEAEDMDLKSKICRGNLKNHLNIVIAVEKVLNEMGLKVDSCG